jgi:hypothetical protein
MCPLVMHRKSPIRKPAIIAHSYGCKVPASKGFLMVHRNCCPGKERWLKMFNVARVTGGVIHTLSHYSDLYLATPTLIRVSNLQ